MTIPKGNGTCDCVVVTKADRTTSSYALATADEFEVGTLTVTVLQDYGGDGTPLATYGPGTWRSAIVYGRDGYLVAEFIGTEFIGRKGAL